MVKLLDGIFKLFNLNAQKNNTLYSFLCHYIPSLTHAHKKGTYGGASVYNLHLYDVICSLFRIVFHLLVTCG